MGRHSVAEAKSRLSSLIDRALEGEEVIVTRHGTPVVEIRPLARTGRAMTAQDFAYFRSRRVKPARPGTDAADLVRRMRDEGL
jgi:prevent-host-death family protein